MWRKGGLLVGEECTDGKQRWDILDSISLFWVELGSLVAYNSLCSWGQTWTPKSPVSSSQALRLQVWTIQPNSISLPFQKKELTGDLSGGWIRAHTREMAGLENERELPVHRPYLSIASIPFCCPEFVFFIFIVNGKRNPGGKEGREERREERMCG